jgi:hypothetical protein
MPNVEDSELEIPELSPAWFERAVRPNRRALRRGEKRAVFIDDELAKRFGSDEDLGGGGLFDAPVAPADSTEGGRRLSDGGGADAGVGDVGATDSALDGSGTSVGTDGSE